jgi:MFS family permease
MIPTVFATAFIVFPRSKQPLISTLIGLVATLAPTVGPTVGGHLTDTLSWHWLFFINVLPSIGVTLAALALIDFDKPDLIIGTQIPDINKPRTARPLSHLPILRQRKRDERGCRFRRIKTQTVLPSADTAAMLFWAAALVDRNGAQGNTDRHRSMVVESNA